MEAGAGTAAVAAGTAAGAGAGTVAEAVAGTVAAGTLAAAGVLGVEPVVVVASSLGCPWTLES